MTQPIRITPVRRAEVPVPDLVRLLITQVRRSGISDSAAMRPEELR